MFLSVALPLEMTRLKRQTLLSFNVLTTLQDPAARFADEDADVEVLVQELRDFADEANPNNSFTKAVYIPVIAIAGITVERVAACLDAGAWGVAVLSPVACSDVPRDAAAAFRAEIDRWLFSADSTEDGVGG